MDAFLQMLNGFWQTAMNYISTFWDQSPREILYFGLVAGFLSSIPEKQPYSYRETNKTLLDIRRASSILCSLSIVAVGAYIFYISGINQLGYYLGSLLIGLVIYALIAYLLDQVSFVGTFFRNLFTIASGPVLIFMAWFFYTGELLEVMSDLLRKIPL